MKYKNKTKFRKKNHQPLNKLSSSRSSSACSSSCYSLNNQIVNENLNSSSSKQLTTSQSNLSDISSSGFSSASTTFKEELKFNKILKPKNLNLKFSRSSSPLSTSSLNSSISSNFLKLKNNFKNNELNKSKLVENNLNKKSNQIKIDKCVKINLIKSVNKSSIDLKNENKLTFVNYFIFNLFKSIYNYLDYIIILIISILINLNTLDANFVYDDNRAIIKNPDVKWSTPLINLFKNDFWGTPINTNNSHKSYRPLCVLTFRLNHYFHQFNPRGYHLVNLIIYCLICLLYTFLIKRWTYNQNNKEDNFNKLFNLNLKQLSAINLIKQIKLPPIYLISSLLFVVHPVHTEAIAGLVGRADIGCALFFLLSLYFYDNYLTLVYNSLDNDDRFTFSKNMISNELNGRGRTEFKERRLMNDCIYRTTTNTKWTNLIQLYLSITCAIISMLFKEYGLTVFIVCLFYHLIKHCNYLKNLAYQFSKRRRLINLNIRNSILRRRCLSFSKLTTSKQEEIFYSPLQNRIESKFSSKFFAFLRCLNGIKNNKLFNEVRIGWIHLILSLAIVLSFRVWIMGKLPQFSTADNPIAANKCLLTRTLTFFWLITFNFGLLLYPVTLSFDWSMDTIPLVKFNDQRNLITLIFFNCLIYFVIKLVNHYIELIDNCLEILDDKTNYNNDYEINNIDCYSYNIQNDHHLNNIENFNHFNDIHNDIKFFDKQQSYYHYNDSDYESSNFDESSDSHESSDQYYHKSKKLNQTNFKENQLNFKTIDICSISIILLILPFLPQTNLVAYVGFVVAERCLFIPSMGFCLLIALAVVQFKQQLVKLTLKTEIYKTDKSSLNLIRKYRKSNHQNNDKSNWFSDFYQFNKKIKDLKFVNKNINLNEFIDLLLNLVLFSLLICLAYRTYLRNFDWSNEETLYRSGININPAKSLGNLGSILSSNGFKEEAEQSYRKALEYRGNMADVHYNLGILLQDQKRYDDALESYQKAIKYRPSLASAYLNMGYIYNLIGKSDQAIEMFKMCASINGNSLKDLRTHEQSKISALLNLGKLYADQNNYQEALKIYKQAINKDESRTYYQLHSLYNLIGEAYLNLEKYEQAEKFYLKSFKLKSDHLPLYLTYAKYLSKMKRYNEAESWFLNARKLSPNDTSILLHYGQYLVDLKKFEKAADIYTDSLKSLPKNFELLSNFANVLRLAKRYTQSEYYYELAVKLNPNDVKTNLNLGSILHLNGKLNKAKKYYQKSLELRPNNPIALVNLKKLNNLLKQKNIVN